MKKSKEKLTYVEALKQAFLKEINTNNQSSINIPYVKSFNKRGILKNPITKANPYLTESDRRYIEFLNSKNQNNAN